MLTITEQAARQIQTAAREGGMEGMALRIAAKRRPDGGIDYAMGFDDIETQDRDVCIAALGVEVVIGEGSVDLLENAVLDYVEIEPGEFRFIFLNPDDPHYVPPRGSRA